jgi:hypothetical protein
MGETEHGDPEADDDDMDGDGMEGDGDGDGDGDGEEEEVVVDEMPLGRPSIDSMNSMASVASVETVRASADNATLSVVSSPNTPTVGGMGTMDHAKQKGKGKETVEPDENAEHSDSDDSLYFDARDSVIVSPKDLPKMIERRRSQQQHPPLLTNIAAAAAARQSLQLPTSTAHDRFIRDGSFARDRTSLPAREGSIRSSLYDERHKRDSTWSISTARESVYYTPTEGQSAFLSSNASAFTAGQELLMNTSASAFAKEIAAKRASVPATFGIPLSSINTMTKDGTVARRGGDSRFSMSRLTSERDGLPAVDLSTLGFDPSQFSSKTPTPGAGPAPMDGLPAFRRDGMPNFDGIVPFTSTNANESAGVGSGGIQVELGTPRLSGYFNDTATSKVGSATNSPSAHFRRGSISASASIPTSIAEDLPIKLAEAEEAHEGKSSQRQNNTRAVRTASPYSAGIALPLDLSVFYVIKQTCVLTSCESQDFHSKLVKFCKSQFDPSLFVPSSSYPCFFPFTFEQLQSLLGVQQCQEA